jgi:hypothetical protein
MADKPKGGDSKTAAAPVKKPMTGKPMPGKPSSPKSGSGCC